MNVALILLAYAVLAAVAGPALLRRAAWLERTPRLAIWAWQALSIAVVSAAVLAGLTVLVPLSVLGADLAQFLHTCVLMLQAAYATPGGALVVTAALTASAVITGRALWGVGAELLAAHWQRRRHLAVLEMVARRAPGLGALVLDHEDAAAYCLPGRGGRIVLTSKALAALGDRQIAAVLAHERAHLCGHHHLLVALARGLRRAFPLVPLFELATREIARLAELAADDAAVKVADRLTVADALLTLADSRVTPRPALAASGQHTAERVRRLLGGTPRPRAIAIVAAGLLALVVIVTPVLVAAAPALTAAGRNYCVIM